MILDPWTPSAPFAVEAGKTAWIQVTHRPTTQTLFALTTDIADVHEIREGAKPKIDTNPNGDATSRDPVTNIHKPLAWQQLPLGKGSWRLYSEENPGIEVVSCPNS